MERCSKEISSARELISKCKLELQTTNEARYRSILMMELECHVKSLANLNSVHTLMIRDLENPQSVRESQSRTDAFSSRPDQMRSQARNKHGSNASGTGSCTGSIPFHIWQHIIELEIPMYGKEHAVILGRISSACIGLRRLCSEGWTAHRARPHLPGRAWLMPGTVLGCGVLKQPWGVAVDRDGKILVADRGHHRIVIFSADGNFVSLAPDTTTFRQALYQSLPHSPPTSSQFHSLMVYADGIATVIR